MHLKSTRAWLMAIGVSSGAALAGALLAQHLFNMPPCSWCVLQRIVLIELMLGGLIGAFMFKDVRFLERLISAVLIFASALGVVFAIYQTKVANELLSCDQSFADKALQSIPLGEYLPSVFGVYASCLEANISIMGIGFAAWAGLFFTITFFMAVNAMRISFKSSRQ